MPVCALLYQISLSFTVGSRPTLPSQAPFWGWLMMLDTHRWTQKISTFSVSLGQLWRWQFFMWVLAPHFSRAPEHNYAQTGSVGWKIKHCFYDAMKSRLFPPKKETYLFPCVYGFAVSVEGLSLWNCWFMSMSNVKSLSWRVERLPNQKRKS